MAAEEAEDHIYRRRMWAAEEADIYRMWAAEEAEDHINRRMWTAHLTRPRESLRRTSLRPTESLRRTSLRPRMVQIRKMPQAQEVLQGIKLQELQKWNDSYFCCLHECLQKKCASFRNDHSNNIVHLKNTWQDQLNLTFLHGYLCLLLNRKPGAFCLLISKKFSNGMLFFYSGPQQLQLC